MIFKSLKENVKDVKRLILSIRAYNFILVFFITIFVSVLMRQLQDLFTVLKLFTTKGQTSECADYSCVLCNKSKYTKTFGFAFISRCFSWS